MKSRKATNKVIYEVIHFIINFLTYIEGRRLFVVVFFNLSFFYGQPSYYELDPQKVKHFIKTQLSQGKKSNKLERRRKKHKQTYILSSIIT